LRDPSAPGSRLGMRIVGAFLAMLLLAPQVHADPLKDALRRLQERYDTTKTMTANFEQSVASKTLAGTLESKGTVSFEKPNRMRWDYAAPDSQQIIGDGETLWIYQPDDKQVIKASIDKAFQAKTPVNFLGGLGQIDQDFNATLEKDEPEQWVLRLVPKKDKGIGTLSLSVRKSDASIAEARIEDPLGTVTRLRLSGEKRNVELAGNLFSFIPPAGVDVVKPPTY
jgi:outer membrane lipoprotein carrier protein